MNAEALKKISMKMKKRNQIQQEIQQNKHCQQFVQQYLKSKSAEDFYDIDQLAKNAAHNGRDYVNLHLRTELCTDQLIKMLTEYTSCQVGENFQVTSTEYTTRGRFHNMPGGPAIKVSWK
jgi:hypothetical protein